MESKQKQLWRVDCNTTNETSFASFYHLAVVFSDHGYKAHTAVSAVCVFCVSPSTHTKKKTKSAKVLSRAEASSATHYWFVFATLPQSLVSLLLHNAVFLFFFWIGGGGLRRRSPGQMQSLLTPPQPLFTIYIFALLMPCMNVCSARDLTLGQQRSKAQA